METQEATVENADIWTRYFEDQWGRWLTPLGTRTPLSELAETTAANVASLLTLVVSAPIAWLFNANAPHVGGGAQHLRPAMAYVQDDERAA